ncbi:Hemolysin activation/secretion protein [Cedecea sp. NFIX57]|nr:ShlB/FhaC/HecB family hemolysin secretion/activation protein [Cedecea sp. NFIX57]SMG24592.1 Hemolysin activation/secretion protein [Cedecea sp. NFIX57]
MPSVHSFLFNSLAVFCAGSVFQTLAAPDSSRLFDHQQQHQQAQQDAREAQLAPQAPGVRLEADTTPDVNGPFPAETPCFPIHTVELSGRQAFPHWVPLPRIANAGVGHCLGIKGINQLISRIQNNLIEHGWVTSRVLAPEQDLRSGTLQLTLFPGKVRAVRYKEDADSRAIITTAMPVKAGDLLDLRDIEQGLENLQRLPTVEASMELVPGEQPGESDIVIARKQSRLWHTSVWVDDSGTKSTGRTQGGVMLALDNPLALSDLFYVSAGHDLGFQGKKQSTSLNAHYSLPWGYWLFDMTGGRSNYVQSIAGLNGDIRYSGLSKNLNTGLSRVIQRGSNSKTTLRYGVLYRETRNYINDTELDIQRRRTSAWQLGLSHRHYLGAATLDAGVSYQRGTRWFGAMPAWEEQNPEGDYATALSKILTWNASLNLPFALANQQFRYQVSWLRQTSSTPLTPQDQFSIGNRWTVRGFDGERSLSANHGWYVQNTLAWQTPLPQQELYLGADYGEVGGRADGFALLGRHLAGAVSGVRGNISSTGIGYDLFAGIPLSKPSGFRTDPVTLGFSVNWQY